MAPIVVKIKPIQVAFIIVTTILSLVAFALGRSLPLAQKFTPIAMIVDNQSTVMATDKSAQPTLNFYLMSFCPGSHQLIQSLQPVAKLFGQKVNFQPHYLFSQIDNLASYCQQKPLSQRNTCLNENNYLRSTDNLRFGSTNGRSEINENIRELCAWTTTNDKSLWWQFIKKIDTNCTPANIDSCWSDQAKTAGLDTTKITECLNTNGITIIKNEITQSSNVTASPQLSINGRQLTLQSLQPNTIKETLCSAFNTPPDICQTVLPTIKTNNTIQNCQL